MSSTIYTKLDAITLATSVQQHAYWLEVMVAERTAALSAANQKLHRLATLDGLTLVANRHRFDEYCQQQWPLLIKQQQLLSLILLDVDYFKQYNDCYGHQVGDDCLKRIARCIEDTIKPGASRSWGSSQKKRVQGE